MEPNEVQKSRRKVNLNLLYELIKKSIPISHKNSKGEEENSICKMLGVTKSAISYHLSILKKANLIKRVGFGVWEIIGEYDEECVNQVKKTRQVTKDKTQEYLNLMNENDVRGHAFMFTLKIPRLPNWDKREDVLKKKGLEFDTLNNFGGGQRILFNGRKIHLKNNSIITYETLNYLSEMASSANSLALYNYKSLMKSLENKLGADFTINGRYVFKVSRRHFSLVKNSLARQINNEGKKLEVYDIKGRWLIIDKSFSNDELETVNPESTIPDNEGLQKFFNSQKETNYKVTPHFILESFNKNQQQLNLLISRDMFHADNIRSHVSAIQSLDESAKELKSGIKILSDAIKNLMDLKK